MVADMRLNGMVRLLMQAACIVGGAYANACANACASAGGSEVLPAQLDKKVAV